MPEPMKGALAPVITPLTADYRPDADRLVEHCRWLIERDCGLAVFGTNSEGNSLALGDKMELLDHLVESGLPAERMMPGTGQCALHDTVKLSRRAVELGCGGVLMLPPFYYKGVSDEGLFRYFSEVIEGVGDDRLRVYLYHIPPVSQVGFSLDLIDRLINAYPDIVAGIKDSSGDWENTRAMLERFPGWGVFCGNELRLLDALKLGGAGVISATCNINPGPIAALYRNWRDEDAAARQEKLNEFRSLVQSYPLIQALKAITAHSRNEPAWERVMPPLVELDAEQRAALIEQCAETGFSME
ncbi:dihydrodipicolinate synthase family protein [Chelativorans sp. YIM 93263]|uniref:dihydrodipicolinate synthase family protein n=1 Tax=Chelativorans sp. YIM 93263 TaxID=2906648 RepID=UPI0023781320|nr:dihydrodipicolinate synthase family protein [Chelativorans sp. YIM 93263]